MIWKKDSPGALVRGKKVGGSVAAIKGFQLASMTTSSSSSSTSFSSASGAKPVVVLLVLALLAAALLIGGLWLFYVPATGTGVGSVVAPDVNVVLIVMDAFRFDRVGAQRNGVALTPFLDELMGESAFFTEAMSNCTWTRPSMSSLFTSLYVDSHQVIYDTLPPEGSPALAALSHELTPMAAVMKAWGYDTIGIQTNGNLLPEFGFDRGFDVYRVSVDDTGSVVSDWALEELAKVKGSFFLYAHYMDPHLPYNPPPEYRSMMGYDRDALEADEAAVVEDFLDYLMAHCKYKTGQIEGLPMAALSEAGREAVRCLYDACIRYTDDQLRRLVTAVRSQAPETLFVILADHGEHFWDHDLLGHGLSLYECELHVPLLLFGPGVPKGVYTHPVQLIDVLPSLSLLLGTAASDTWQGRTLFDDSPRPLYAKTRGMTEEWNTDLESVIDGDRKLIVDHGDGSAQLYAWRADRMESANLAASEADTVRRMQSLLETQYKANLRARRGVGQEVTIDEETREQLRRLGYMD